MILQKVLKSGNVCPNLTASSKEGIIDELLALLDSLGSVKDLPAARGDVMKREKELSTGLAHGIAFPHAKTAAVEKLSVAVGLKPEGIDFESLDGQPSKVFILTLVPVEENDQYLEFMGAINRRLTDAGIRKQLIDASDAAEVVKILASDPS